MTSNIQVGLSEDNGPRRAISQQGRTHTDIFGIEEQAHQPTPQKPSSDNKSVVVEETDGKKEVQKESQKENKTENGNVEGFQRVRMPPGGFSAGFW